MGPGDSAIDEKADKEESSELSGADAAARRAAEAAGMPLASWVSDAILTASSDELDPRVALGGVAGTGSASVVAQPTAVAELNLPEEARVAAEQAAAAAGVPMGAWIGGLLKEMIRSELPAVAAAAGALPLLSLRRAPVDRIIPSRFQMRARFDPEQISALAESIKARGVLQPIIVRERHDETAPFEIIAGERRWRAAREAGLADVPILALEVTDRETLEIALVENLQRQELSPLEEAEGYRRLVEEMGETQDRLAEAIGKSRSHVSNTLRLLRLPEGVKSLLAGGKLSAGHARAILGAADPEGLAHRVVDSALSVRETERLAQETPAPVSERGKRAAGKDPDLENIEGELSRVFGVAVRIALRGSGDRGTLTIRFKGLEKLHDLIERLRT
jgi:ParB family chromosome partitioning protein